MSSFPNGTIESRSVVDAVRCAIEVQNGLIERNAGVAEDRRNEFRVGIQLCRSAASLVAADVGFAPPIRAAWRLFNERRDR